MFATSSLVILPVVSTDRNHDFSRSCIVHWSRKLVRTLTNLWIWKTWRSLLQILHITKRANQLVQRQQQQHEHWTKTTSRFVEKTFGLAEPRIVPAFPLAHCALLVPFWVHGRVIRCAVDVEHWNETVDESGENWLGHISVFGGAATLIKKTT